MFSRSVLFSLLFCDEIPLDAIKSLPKSPLKLHNYRNKKITILIERSSALGAAWSRVGAVTLGPGTDRVRGSAELQSTAH